MMNPNYSTSHYPINDNEHALIGNMHNCASQTQHLHWWQQHTFGDNNFGNFSPSEGISIQSSKKLVTIEGLSFRKPPCWACLIEMDRQIVMVFKIIGGVMQPWTYDWKVKNTAFPAANSMTWFCKFEDGFIWKSLRKCGNQVGILNRT